MTHRDRPVGRRFESYRAHQKPPLIRVFPPGRASHSRDVSQPYPSERRPQLVRALRSRVDIEPVRLRPGDEPGVAVRPMGVSGERSSRRTCRSRVPDLAPPAPCSSPATSRASARRRADRLPAAHGSLGRTLLPRRPPSSARCRSRRKSEGRSRRMSLDSSSVNAARVDTVSGWSSENRPELPRTWAPLRVALRGGTAVPA
jgi:hypothetical protein